MQKPIVLVACGSQKLDHAAAAKDLYTGDLFRKARAYAETFGYRWLILSAKHGLIDPEQVIEPYDEFLCDKSSSERDAWAELVRSQWSNSEGRPVVVLAGAAYREAFETIEHTAPMKGMGIGQQKAWLKAQVEAPADSQALTEAKAMVADLTSATTLNDLDALYVNWIGYSAIADDPLQTAEQLRGDLRDYIKEFCVSTGVHCADAGIVDDSGAVMSAQHTQGCCADKSCNDKTCMALPAGKTCGDCAHIRHCAAFYAHTPTDTYCDFFPRRFVERAAIAKATGSQP